MTLATVELGRADGSVEHCGRDIAFQQDLAALIPQLKAFSRSLCRDASQAEDLAQDALTAAWKARESYTAGTNLRAWLYRILRNRFYSHVRRSWRSVPLNPEVAEATLPARDNAECILELDEVRRALANLTERHREALLIVGVGGFSYDEAADFLKIPAGTVKSRVCRARKSLTSILEENKHGQDGRAATQAFDDIVGQLSAYPLQ